MKLMMVEGRYRGEMDYSGLDEGKLPKKLGLVSTVQFLDYIDEFTKLLESKGIEVFKAKKRQLYDTQLLGCDQGAAKEVKDEVDAFIYLGTGRFHPLGVVLSTGKDVHCYDPLTTEQTVIEGKEYERMQKRRKGAYMAYLNADNVGVIVSTKPGQNHFRQAMALKEHAKEKNIFIFLADTIEFNQVENFPFIDCWVNTACNRIMDDTPKFPKPLVDLSDLQKEELVQLKI